MRILIADDSKSDRLILGGYVTQCHDIPEFAENGTEALASYFKNKPDLLILDVNMPKLNGYEVAKAIREYDKKDDDWVPIIFLSAHLDDASIVKGIESGGDDYLTKPISFIVLKSKIDAMKRIMIMRNKLLEVNSLLSDLSLKDSLTGLYNRRAFEETIEKESRSVMRSGGVIALMMIDLDNFKNYNDVNGHQMGDECLQKVAKCMQMQLHRATDFIARYGGEEFSVILTDTSLKGALAVAERIRSSVAELILLHKGKERKGAATLSVGVAVSESGVLFSTQAIIAHADNALYQAKASGKNRVVASHEPLGDMIKVPFYKTI